MTARRKEVELSVERPLGPPSDPRAEVVRLTARFELEGEGAGPTTEELEIALRSLRDELDRIPGMAAGSDRSLEELVDAYRPRQAELVDLLRDEGAITPGEHTALRAYLAQQPLAPARAETPRPSAPSAPAPPAAKSKGARPVEQILEEYRIQSLREAGLVRARRQISFDEYMALKRHFESRNGAPAASTHAPA